MNIALIPARGGSKSIRKKNIANLGGYPMIYYSIYVAKRTSNIDRVIVSTDDDEIRGISLKYGAEAPFLRPKEFSSDHSNDFAVVKHLLNWLMEYENETPEMITYLRPDSPFRKVSILEDAIKTYINDPLVDGLRSVQRSNEIPYKTWTIRKGYLKPLIEYGGIKDPHNAARQLFPETYWPVGYIEIYDTHLVVTKDTLRGERMIPYLIEEELINVGSYEELRQAEDCLKSFKFES